MANVKTVQIRRNLAPNVYYLNMQVNGTLMQEYDVQEGTWSPAVTARDTWRTLITANVKRVSVDGTASREQIGIASYQYLFRVAGTAEWKDLSEVPATNGRQQLNSWYGGGFIYLRHCANIPAGVVYEVKCVATVADEDIRRSVTVESDIYRIGCNDKTLDEIRFRLVRGSQNIIYNPEAPAPYTVEGLERATFLQQVEFEVTKGGKKYWSDDLVVRCEYMGQKWAQSEGVELVYEFTKWKSLPDWGAETDQLGNSVIRLSDTVNGNAIVGLHCDTWTINKGGLFTYAPGARKMDILWERQLQSIQLYVSAGTSGTTANESWVTLDQPDRAEIKYSGSGESMQVGIYITNQGDSITEKGITLTVARNLVIQRIEVMGLDAESVLHGTGCPLYSYGTSYGYNLPDERNHGGGLDVVRFALQKLESAAGTVTVTMDCGTAFAGGTALRLYNKDRTVLYDERVISFQQRVPQIDVSVENLPFVENKKNAKQRMLVRLFAEGHEVTEYGFYEVKATAKKADGDTGTLEVRDITSSFPKYFEFELDATAEGTVTFEPKLKKVLDVF